MPYTPPAREAYWASQLHQRSQWGTNPYVAGEGYWLDGDDHYDTPLGYPKVQDYAVARGLTYTDYSVEIAAALLRFRDRAIRGIDRNFTDQGVNNYHKFAGGIARHYAETAGSEPADLEALDLLLPPTLYSDAFTRTRLMEDYTKCSVQRECALLLWAACERYAVGLGEHLVTDDAAGLCLLVLAEQVDTSAARRFGVMMKPWMAALSALGLIRYREVFAASADATKVANRAAIPDSLAALGDYIWTYCWFPPGPTTTDDPWGLGALKYIDIAIADPSVAPITGLVIQAVGEPAGRVFTGPASLSTLDDRYRGCHAIFDHIAETYLILDYDGATRQFTLGSTHYPSGVDVLAPGDTFRIESSFHPGDPTERPIAAEDLNLMVFPLFAWLYRYYTIEAPDATLAATARERAHAFFDGAYQAHYPANTQKTWNQAALWTTDGLAYLAEADEYEAAPTTGSAVLFIPSGGGYLMIPAPAPTP